MNRALLAALMVLLVATPLVAAQNGRTTDTYIRLQVEVDFQYRSDHDVRLPLQVMVVQHGVRQDTPVQISVVAKSNRAPITIPGGQEWLNQGIKAYPASHEINFGRLEAGLYEWLFIATSGTLREELVVKVPVTLPPVKYSASLQGTSGKQAVFLLDAHDVNDTFQVEMFRDGGGGRVSLDRITGSHVELVVPYIPNEAVKITVIGPNGWANYANKFTDFSTGSTTYPDWQWNPDYKAITNARQASFGEAVGVSALLACLAGLLVFAIVRARRS